MERLARILKTIGHPDRLRILALLQREELTISELTSILRMSQPRVTQYVNSLEDAGLVERFREGSWVFSRLSGAVETSAIMKTVLSALPDDDVSLEQDRDELNNVRQARKDDAARFFADVANDRGQLSHEFLPRRETEAAMLALSGRAKSAIVDAGTGLMVDLGTGAGGTLALFSDCVAQGIGFDRSTDMLRVARQRLAEPSFSHLGVQQGDLTQTLLADGVADLVTLHHVLHYLSDPGAALAEAARLLSPSGRVLIADFDAHDRDEFRATYAHRRLGFSEDAMRTLLRGAGLDVAEIRRIAAPQADMPDTLVWAAERGALASTSKRQKAER